ncbi:formyltransferase family protein [Methanomicrobium mobile]|uniref:formyltransferase family protein n=1 Tax=Methanomicrobium mobile TaxID=2205 RepID=UPI0012F627D0|nr:formyltransferase family protein [Methanomicrobium mobile]
MVIGYGLVTRNVLSFIDSVSDRHGYSITYVEHEKYPFNGAKKYAESNKLESFLIDDKYELTSFILKRAELGHLLIISASNNFLFPKKVVENKNIRIVNFHNALLPNLPGRNAPSWAIYNGYEKTGITWHYVDAEIDTGDIIIQKECSIYSDTKAYELVTVQMKLAGDAFMECFEKILADSVVTKKQDLDPNRKVYKSSEIPGDGMFDINDSAENIYRLLRAMDYGKNDLFPHPTTIYNGHMITVKRYKKVSSEEKMDSANKLYIPFGDGMFLMLRYDMR